jgi:hypothetical protein
VTSYYHKTKAFVQRERKFPVRLRALGILAGIVDIIQGAA